MHKVPISTFFSELADYLESVVLCQEQLLISGDFNIHLDNAVDTDAIKLVDLLESHGLQQHVTSPTRKHDHTNDLIITRQSDQLLGNTPRIVRYDRSPILMRKVFHRKLQSVSVVSLNTDLATSELCLMIHRNLFQLITIPSRLF